MSTYNYRFTTQATGVNLAVVGSNYCGNRGGGSTKNAGGVVYAGGTISNGGTLGVNVDPQTGKRAAFAAITPGINANPIGVIVYNSAINFSGAGAGGTLTVRSPGLDRWCVWPALGYSAGAVVGKFAQMVNNNRTIGGTDGGTRGFIIRRVTTQLAVGPLGTEGVSKSALKSGGSDFGLRKSILATNTSGLRTKTLVSLSWAAANYLGAATPVRSSGVNNLPTYTMVTNLNQALNLAGQNSTLTVPSGLGTQDFNGQLPSGIAIPGQLVYMAGNPVPKFDVFKNKTTW